MLSGCACDTRLGTTGTGKNAKVTPCFPYVLGVTYMLGSPGSFENCLTGPNWARVNQTSKDGCRHQHPWRVPRGF